MLSNDVIRTEYFFLFWYWFVLLLDKPLMTWNFEFLWKEPSVNLRKLISSFDLINCWWLKLRANEPIITLCLIRDGAIKMEVSLGYKLISPLGERRWIFQGIISIWKQTHKEILRCAELYVAYFLSIIFYYYIILCSFRNIFVCFLKK